MKYQHRLCRCGHASYEVCNKCATCGRSLIGVPLSDGEANEVNEVNKAKGHKPLPSLAGFATEMGKALLPPNTGKRK